MIWVVFFILLALAGFYVMRPFLMIESGTNDALDEARGQRTAIDIDAEAGRLTPQAAEEARDALDRRILALLDAEAPQASATRLKSLALVAVPAVLLLGGVGIYLQIGAPDYRPITFAEYQAQQAADLPDTLGELVVELKSRLEADPNPPADGYVLLARSYLRLGDADGALAAYETAIRLSGDAPIIIEERDEVLRIVRERAAAPPIDPETRAQIEAMSPDEQAAMIEGMVAGLAARLEQDPNDLAGWLRLIRARVVMGDLEQARQDLAIARQSFPPNTLDGERLTQLAAELLPPPPESPQD